MQMISVNKLNPHPKNNYFFDDMSGEAWMAFIESVETSGIIEPIVVTQDLTIVSGHQRVRACKELKIKEILAETRVYESEDEVLKQLIETNIRQRGIGNVNPVKFGRCLKELERIYGIKQGRPEKNSNNVGNKTQDDLLEELGMNKETYRQAKKLAELPEEIQQMVMDGKVTASTASRVIARMSPEEQEQLAEQIRGKEKVSSRDIEFYKKRVQKLSDENAELRKRQPEIRTVEKEVEVIPDDYEKLQQDNATLRSDYKRIEKERQQYADEMLAAQKRIRELETPSNNEKIVDEAKDQMDNFSIATYNYIRKYGGFVWAFDKWGDIPEETRKNFTNAITALNGFVQQMEINMKGVK